MMALDRALRWTILLAVISLGLIEVALAAERGVVIRAGDLKTQAFIDAPSAAPVAASEQVTILDRKGGWMQVQTASHTGWIRMLNVRLASSDNANQHSSGVSASAALLRTGSSGKTVTTGVKGLGEEDLRNAVANMAEVDRLNSLLVPPAEARTNAQRSGLHENTLEYLGKAGKK